MRSEPRPEYPNSSARPRKYFLGGVLIALLGAICFSTKAIFVKLAYRDSGIDAITLLALRMVFSLPFFLMSAWSSSRQKNNVRFTLLQWIQIAIVGLLGYYISSLLDFLGLQYVTAGIERLILFVYPTLVLLMSALIFREKINKMQWLAIAITYGGLLLAFFSEVDLTAPQGGRFLRGSLLIFVCAFTYAGYIVGSGRLIPVVGPAKFNSYAMTFASAGVLLHFLLNGPRTVLPIPMSTYGLSICMAVLATVVPSYLVSEGIKRIGSDNVAIVGSVGPVSTILMASIFLQESVGISQWVGTALILAGVLLITRQKTARPA